MIWYALSIFKLFARYHLLVVHGGLQAGQVDRPPYSRPPRLAYALSVRVHFSRQPTEV